MTKTFSIFQIFAFTCILSITPLAHAADTDGDGITNTGEQSGASNLSKDEHKVQRKQLKKRQKEEKEKLQGEQKQEKEALKARHRTEKNSLKQKRKEQKIKEKEQKRKEQKKT